MSLTATPQPLRRPTQFIGGWEFGLLALMLILYLAGAVLNPKFFGSTEAFSALLRDSARYGIMAVGMTFVIVNKDLDLSVGSTYGLVAVAFAVVFAPSHYDAGIVPALIIAILVGALIGLINGLLVTLLRVPAFIATLTMLLIGRGFVLGLTGGKNIAFRPKAREHPEIFQLGEISVLDLNNQVFVFAIIAVIGAVVLAKTRWGYETYATGGNEQAAGYAGIPTRWVRIRAYLMSSLCASIAGLLEAFQNKTVTSQFGLGDELVVIAAVIIGGASILGGRGRVIGSCLGALLAGLINKVLREGWPTTRTSIVNGQEVTVNAYATLPAGAVPAFIGVILLIAVLIEPYIIRRRVPARLWAWFRGKPPPQAYETGGVAIEGAQTKGSMAADIAMSARGFGKFLARRDALAIILAALLWVVGLFLRPDYWWHLPNTFAILLNYTELAILTIGLTYVIAAGDIDLSVGAVLALAGSTAAYCLKVLGLDPWQAVVIAMMVGTMAGVVNGLLTVGFGLPAFIATLGMFYIARGLAAWIVAGQQLTGFPEQFNLFGRKLVDVLDYLNLAAPAGVLADIAHVVSVQTIWMALIAIIAGVVLGTMPFGQRVYATGGNIRAAAYAGINTRRVRFIALVLAGLCATMAGIINVAYFRSFNPVAGVNRELDAIASVIIGGGSIFGGYGTIIGSLAGAAVITLVRALLQLNVQGFTMPQHWINVFIGVILIAAVLIDIWLRQENILGAWRARRMRRREPAAGTVHA